MDLKIKICGITDLEDALAAAEAGADAIGFMFYKPSPRYVSIERAEAIARELPPFVMRVGVFVDAEPELVRSAISRCGLSLLQFHGAESSDFCTQFGVMNMKAFRIKDADSLREISHY